MSLTITYFLENGTLKVRADKPYLHVYNIDYLNISRASSGDVSISTEIGATSSGVSSASGGGLSAVVSMASLGEGSVQACKTNINVMLKSRFIESFSGVVVYWVRDYKQSVFSLYIISLIALLPAQNKSNSLPLCRHRELSAGPAVSIS